MREGLHKIVSDNETIVAIATPPGNSAIGVIRISGVDSLNVARRFFQPRNAHSNLQHRLVSIGTWTDLKGEKIDEVLLTFFQAPNSYTGENLLEISAHGSPLSLQRIVATVRSAGVRLAGPGEFTLRAVGHGKMDLVQAEAVKEFIEAQTEQQARLSLRQIEGALSKHIRPIKDALINVIAHMEAGIDFAEDDVNVPDNESIAVQIRGPRLQLEDLRDTFGYGKILSKGLRLTILGKPNVGKSSLFNRLVSFERAIVTDIPGTTRDVLTETVSLAGVPLSFADTAGIRSTTDEVESIGVTRTFESVAESDLALIVLDGSQTLDEYDRQALGIAIQIPHIAVINKTDLAQELDVSALENGRCVRVSAKTGAGLEGLRSELKKFVLSRKTTTSDDLILRSARQHEAVTIAAASLQVAEEAVGSGVPHEMVLLDLYCALGALDELTGEVVTDDILERIFSTFCIGK